MITAVVIATFFVIGTVLLAIGLRGRRTGVERACHKCGFDLAGLDGVGEDGCVCPECGIGLDRPWSVRRWPRRKAGGMVLAGAIMLVGSAVLAFAVVGTGVMPLARLPLPVLELQARLGSTATRLDVIDELIRRDGLPGGIPASSRSVAIDIVLDEYAKDPQAWVISSFAQFFESSRKAGLVSRAQIERYADAAFAEWPEAEDIRVVAGTQNIEKLKDLMVPPISTSPVPTSTNVAWLADLLSIEVDGVPAERRVVSRAEDLHGSRVETWNGISLTIEPLGSTIFEFTAAMDGPQYGIPAFDLEPGSHVVELKWRVFYFLDDGRYANAWRASAAAMSDAELSDLACLTREFTRSWPVEAVGRDEIEPRLTVEGTPDFEWSGRVLPKPGAAVAYAQNQPETRSMTVVPDRDNVLAEILDGVLLRVDGGMFMFLPEADVSVLFACEIRWNGQTFPAINAPTRWTRARPPHSAKVYSAIRPNDGGRASGRDTDWLVVGLPREATDVVVAFVPAPELMHDPEIGDQLQAAFQGVDTIWGEEIVYKNVKVEWPDE